MLTTKLNPVTVLVIQSGCLAERKAWNEESVHWGLKGSMDLAASQISVSLTSCPASVSAPLRRWWELLGAGNLFGLPGQTKQKKEVFYHTMEPSLQKTPNLRPLETSRMHQGTWPDFFNWISDADSRGNWILRWQTKQAAICIPAQRSQLEAESPSALF